MSTRSHGNAMQTFRREARSALPRLRVFLWPRFVALHKEPANRRPG